MRSFTFFSTVLSAAGAVGANPILGSTKRDACSGNTAADRSTWCDYSTSTDYYNEVPDTGVTREYWLSAEETTLALDGVSRMVQTFNGTIPGPTIFADWGDTVVVHVANNFPTSSNNGTSVHFHGIRQNQTNEMDGVVSITQCPTAPGDSITYTWRATQYGSTWYHSHFALQAWEGMFGGIQIEGPATANYDEDKGILFLNDWSHQTVQELWYSAQTSGPPELQNGLINGTNVYGEDGASNQTGSRFSTTFESGTSYRLRLVNGALDTMFKFSIDNHTLTVIESDLVPIKPYTTGVLSIGIGQRYDVVVTADQAAVASDFWIRAEPATDCSSTNDMQGNIKGIIHYGTSTSTPSTHSHDIPTDCYDEDASDLVPFFSVDASSASTTNDETVTLGTDATGVLFRWFIEGSTFQVEWGNPTLAEILANTSSSAYTTSSNILEVSAADAWVYLVIQNSTPLPHPIHLHGHDFHILAQGDGSAAYDEDTVTLNTQNPPRRDVAMVQASPGYLVLAFQTDNPGAWLAHCHIGWHVAEGFALQYIERKGEIAAITDADALESACSAWDSYATQNAVVDDDSGV